MNSLLSRALELQHAAHELMYLGMNLCIWIRMVVLFILMNSVV